MRTFLHNLKLPLGLTLTSTAIAYHVSTTSQPSISLAQSSSVVASPSAPLIKLNRTSKRRGVLAAVGNTPLIELSTLSTLTGCTILAKCEHLNPGGSIKDRAALFMIEEGERQGLIVKGTTIYEGTGGNTGVGLAMVASAKGYGAVMAMPASIAKEKIDAMKMFGAEVILTPPAKFTDPQHYFHRAREAAKLNPLGFWCNQFDNLENYKSHYYGTAPEMWKQSNMAIDGFVCACGTGGTLAGISKYLKEKRSSIQCYLADPKGSALFDYIQKGEKAEYHEELVGGTMVKFIERDGGSSITEGIGIGRVTKNFSQSEKLIDGALKISDKDAIEMAYYLKENEGVFIGPSAALNVVAAVKLAQKLGKGKTVVTVLCDGGGRYESKIFTKQWLDEKGFVLMEKEERNKLKWLAP